jgi:DNA repair exonuclease SbcCD nuclease subunit
MKTIVLGDTHGRSNWKLAIYQEEPIDRVIFIGDYFDSFDIPGVEQIHNFKEIINYKENNPQVEVILLIGNHDYHYFPEIGYNGTSGYQSKIAPSITQVIEENRHHLQMAYGFDEYLFTHAGVSPVFMDQVFGENNWSAENIVADINEMFRYKPKAFGFNGFDAHGDNTTQTPIWIRPRSLMSANKKHDKGLKKEYIQIVGHTGMKRLDLDGTEKFTGGRYYFIDTMETTGEYLIIKDNKLIVNSTK